MRCRENCRRWTNRVTGTGAGVTVAAVLVGGNQPSRGNRVPAPFPYCPRGADVMVATCRSAVAESSEAGPFAHGVRHCVGFRARQMERSLTVARLAQRLVLVRTGRTVSRPDGESVHQPAGGVS